ALARRREIKFMTYNVWSREDVAVYKRMEAISGLVEKHDPDVIFFQEVTPYIRSIFQSSSWWNDYHSSTVYTDGKAPDKNQRDFCLLLSKFPLENFASRKFADSPTGRGYLEADVSPDPAAAAMKRIRVATTQLERPTPPAPMRFVERRAQAKHAVAALGSAANVVFGGDMSWAEDADGPFPLAAGWLDAWTALRSASLALFSDDWTHDAAWNEEPAVFHGHVARRWSIRKRPDRFLCKLRDYRLSSIKLIGDHDVGPSYSRCLGEDTWSFMDLQPSCHRGLVLTIVPK
uniref:Endonuclease/exonuclease/phosphatase domain-containing protein n=1 Tax=Setaria italica TaxID=4555 RepID=K4A0B0_SETIT